ncbi:hypothetical protein LZ31DRAFT_203154 [Colletotrichum somersetense]|nr:hypothetical protein LZ31DRAFT_203154 [Colletotrichum somersetense]
MRGTMCHGRVTERQLHLHRQDALRKQPARALEKLYGLIVYHNGVRASGSAHSESSRSIIKGAEAFNEGGHEREDPGKSGKTVPDLYLCIAQWGRSRTRPVLKTRSPWVSSSPARALVLRPRPRPKPPTRLSGYSSQPSRPDTRSRPGLVSQRLPQGFHKQARPEYLGRRLPSERSRAFR